MTFTNWTSAAFAGALLLTIQSALVPVLAADSNYSGYAHKPTYQPCYHHKVTIHDYMADHPKVRSATIGAGVGTAAGAVTGLLTGRGVVRGAAIGAGTGAGVGLLSSSRILAAHPIVRDLATGTVVGGGLGMAGGRREGTAAKSALVGGAVGLGLGVFKHM